MAAALIPPLLLAGGGGGKLADAVHRAVRGSPNLAHDACGLALQEATQCMAAGDDVCDCLRRPLDLRPCFGDRYTVLERAICRRECPPGPFPRVYHAVGLVGTREATEASLDPGDAARTASTAGRPRVMRRFFAPNGTLLEVLGRPMAVRARPRRTARIVRARMRPICRPTPDWPRRWARCRDGWG